MAIVIPHVTHIEAFVHIANLTHLTFYIIAVAGIGLPLKHDKVIHLANGIICTNPDQHERFV